MHSQELIEQLEKWVGGKRIRAIHLLTYSYQNETNWENTPLQMTFEDDSVIFLRQAGDGETFSISKEAWQDPFAGSLSEEDKQFIQKHGKWELRDMSLQEPFTCLINETVDEVEPIRNEYGKLSGVILNFTEAKGELKFEIAWDECHVHRERSISE